MDQIATPEADVSVNGWTPVPIYDEINGPYPDDTSFVSSQPNPQGNTFEVDFPVLAQPVSGTYTLTVRLQRTDVAPVAVEVMLRSFGQRVAVRTFYPTTSFADYQIVLTPAEVAQIGGDYRVLSLLVRAGPTKDCPQCAAAALQWQFTLSGITNGLCGNCTALNGSYTLTYTGLTGSGAPECFTSCTWDSGGPRFIGNVDFCNDGIGQRWFMVYGNFNSFNGWHLTLLQGCNINLLPGTPLEPDYMCNGAGGFNCLGTNVFNLFPRPHTCSGLPSSITLTPV
jgi:hypothetical protein